MYPQLWHMKLGHVSNKVLKHLCSQHHNIPFHVTDVCETCHFAKQKRLPFPSSNSIASWFFELIHVDIWGPLAVNSFDGHKYFLTIVDDFSRFTWILLLKTKYEVRQHLTNFILFVENQFNTKLSKLRSDNGIEFSITDFFNSKGILHETSCVETPQQNGIVERKHQHILNVTRALLFQSNLPKEFWSFLLNKLFT
jgi:hypothetical protein